VGIVGAAALIVSAFLCAMYTLNISIRAFFPMQGTDRSGSGGIREAGILMLIPIGVFSVVNIAFGVCSGPVITFLERIAQGII
jgi:multicomponent Na+:H+ antiporter subunit D